MPASFDSKLLFWMEKGLKGEVVIVWSCLCSFTETWIQDDPGIVRHETLGVHTSTVKFRQHNQQTKKLLSISLSYDILYYTL